MSRTPLSDAYTERALNLQPGTLRAHRQKPEISPPELVALLRLIETFPWLLEVADANYDPTAAAALLLRESGVQVKIEEAPPPPEPPLPPSRDPPSDEEFSLLVEGPAEEFSAEPHSTVRVLTRPPNQDDVLHIYTDGSCQGNPGPAGIGVVLIDRLPGANPRRREVSEGIGTGTNNVAELTAVLRGLELVHRQHRTRPIAIYSDSTYVIGVLARGWTARANPDLVTQILRKLGEFPDVAFIKVPAHSGVADNERADQLAKKGTTIAVSQLRSGSSPR